MCSFGQFTQEIPLFKSFDKGLTNILYPEVMSTQLKFKFKLENFKAFIYYIFLNFVCYNDIFYRNKFF